MVIFPFIRPAVAYALVKAHDIIAAGVVMPIDLGKEGTPLPRPPPRVLKVCKQERSFVVHTLIVPSAEEVANNVNLPEKRGLVGSNNAAKAGVFVNDAEPLPGKPTPGGFAGVV
jgi:hypothetical protein